MYIYVFGSALTRDYIGISMIFCHASGSGHDYYHGYGYDYDYDLSIALLNTDTADYC